MIDIEKLRRVFLRAGCAATGEEYRESGDARGIDAGIRAVIAEVAANNAPAQVIAWYEAQSGAVSRSDVDARFVGALQVENARLADRADEMRDIARRALDIAETDNAHAKALAAENDRLRARVAELEGATHQ